MLFDAPRSPPSVSAGTDHGGGQARAKRRPSAIPFTRSLLPSGSPFGWNARGRALYVQFLTALLMAIVTLSFSLFDGWPFLLECPQDEAALRTTTISAICGLAFWIALYLWTWSRPNP
ncbi:MAG: hypothetical protein JRE81_09120, partial [Deltaproteobacteria bacterium]|nr:hypothetical protein [Deltaproteobacteria bacterium]